MSISFDPPPIYGTNPLLSSDNGNKNCFPNIEGSYRNPMLSKVERIALEDVKIKQIGRALLFLASLNPSKIKKIEKKAYVFNNSVGNLFSYLLCNKLEIINRAFCCCLPSRYDHLKDLPVPSEAAETLELTREQFDRNTLGVCCIAPSVIIGSPFVPAGAAVATFLEIFSSLVITTTAGTNTYVFSGDIGVVPDGKGGLCVQGGIRVDAISTIETAYDQIAEALPKLWKSADIDQKNALIRTCLKIRDNWNYMFEEIASCGIKSSAVKKILTRFSISLTDVLDEIEEEAEHSHAHGF